jgi:GT2 family glycosyltransferase
MDLAVVLLNWRDEQRTLRCARSVMGWQALEPQLFVVDNESTEVTRNALSDLIPADNLICSGVNRGYGGGNNLGIKRALTTKAQYILLLNTDADISPAGVSRLIERLNDWPQISILGPVIQEEDEEGTRRLGGGRDIARHRFTRIDLPPGDTKRMAAGPVHDVDYIPGTVFLARTSLWREIGLLDEEYFFSGEIADFCKRAKDKGHRICVDTEVEADHDSRQTPLHIRERLYAYYGLRNRFLYVRKYHRERKLRYFAFWTLVGVAGLARGLLRGNTARARAIVFALIHAYGGRYGNQNAKLL